MASSYIAIQDRQGSLFGIFSLRVLSAGIKTDGPNPTGSRPEGCRSRHSDREHLLVRGFRRRTEEPACSSEHCGTNTEANDRTWVFHSGIYVTQLRRYAAGLLERNGGVIKDRPESVLVHFVDVDDQIAKIFTSFTDLRKAFDSKHILSIALVLSRTATTIDAICGYKCS
ncbi:hypothetical protein PILCRDRAFT_1896 [Piloderma croceum F 1598]|uniref:Uncharacterized protein n=1 Tax=Piloderma croceum (strain F 1598) TaxID=765440 RepID=A0A0C3CIE1_PILCF|nr:hypothetical protein PILCRDRAFT_1896 [Piloderma croceum F 1598]